jgi:hypothetical protein
MKYYIIHYTKYTERRKAIEKQLRAFGIRDVEWIEEYDQEDPLISEIKEKSGSKLSLGYISNSFKHFIAMKRMVDSGIQEAVILEDDVIFYPEFNRYTFFHPCGFLRLCAGQLIKSANPPPRGKVCQIMNAGGSEAQWVSFRFAQAAINNMNFDFTIDLYQYALLKASTGEPLRCLNVSYQSSILDKDTGADEDWDGYIDYCINFVKCKRFTMADFGLNKKT